MQDLNNVVELDLSSIDFCVSNKSSYASSASTGDNKPDSESMPRADKNLENKAVNPFDLVKIKVTLDDNYYIFSRYLISRMLALIGIDKQTAAGIAKSIKKKLVEKQVLEINQNQLEETLFETITQFIPLNPSSVIGTYKIVSEFYRMRTPIIVLIFGAPKIGKSNIANQLADKMNISNVLQTDIIASVMDMMHVPEHSLNTWNDMSIDEAEMIRRYSQKCYQIRKGANTDIQKCLQQGKPVVIEGNELDPEEFLRRRKKQEGGQDERDKVIQEQLQNFVGGTIKEADLLDDYSFNQDSASLELFQPEPQEWEKDAEKERMKAAQDYYEKFDQSQMVVVAFHLVISKKQHLFNIKNSNQILKIPDLQERETQAQLLLKKHQAIQNHLIKKCSLSFTIPIDINCQQYTLDTLQKILLQKIDNWYHSSQQLIPKS